VSIDQPAKPDSPPAAGPHFAGGAVPAGEARVRDLMSATVELALSSVALTSQGASLIGMHPTDMFCLWHVTESAAAEPVTSGQLAELTGLTSGAITGVIDRLEAAGFLRRERDTQDRRKLLLVPVPEKVGQIYELYAPLHETFRAAEARYDEDQQALILNFLRNTTELMRTNVKTLRQARKEERRNGAAG
jgi:DNA-binding MarR family transcriptional regulator